MSPTVPLAVLWLARCAALLVAGAYLILVSGEILFPHSGPPALVREWLGLVLLALSIAGMLLAWKWVLAGALLSLGALLLFVPVARFHAYGIAAVIALPGVLFLLSWVTSRSGTPRPRGVH